MTRIYVLSAGRRGDLNQMVDVATATGLPFEVRTLSFRQAPNWQVALWPRHLLSGSADQAFAGIAAADVVLCAEASVCALVAKGRRAGRVFKAVCIGRPRGNFSAFDLIITSPQYQLADMGNIVELPYPPHQLPGHVLEKLAAPKPAGTQPRHLCLVGGNSPPDMLDAAAVTRIISDLLLIRARRKCDIDILLSPRTPSEAIADFKAANAEAGFRLHGYTQDNGATYWNLLAGADSISVTSDSVSMVVEAMLTGRPVDIHQLSGKKRLDHSFIAWLNRKGIARALFDRGLIELRPNRERLLAGLRQAGLIGSPDPAQAQTRPQSTAALAARNILEKLHI